MKPNTLSEEQIQYLLSLPECPSPGDENRYQTLFPNPPHPAAVLVPILRPFGSSSPWHILLTRRTNDVADHKGQVAFPGGRSEPSDESPQATALREAWEEVGLESDQVNILGVLPNIQTISNYLVTPVVARIPWPFRFRLQVKEVSRIFTIPLAWLALPENYIVRTRHVSFPNLEKPIPLNVFYYKPYNQEVLWGVSADIIQKLVSKLCLNEDSG